MTLPNTVSDGRIQEEVSDKAKAAYAFELGQLYSLRFEVLHTIVIKMVVFRIRDKELRCIRTRSLQTRLSSFQYDERVSKGVPSMRNTMLL